MAPCVVLSARLWLAYVAVAIVAEGERVDVNASMSTALSCFEHEFACAEHCIDRLQRCDMHADCAGGEDEAAQWCADNPCPAESSFECDDGYCVAAHQVCDYWPDCRDASDERNCTYKPCQHMEWQCANRECIELAGLCDAQGVTDCRDGSDEQHCAESDILICDSGSKRIHRSFWCDSHAHCDDQQDELQQCGPCRPTVDANSLAIRHFYRCANERCIPAAHRCDAVCDCGVECDDEGDHCLSSYDASSSSCRVNASIACNRERSARCIRAAFICDGFNDCEDGVQGRDEEGCDAGDNVPGLDVCSIGPTSPMPTEIDNHLFPCSPPDGRRIPLSARCDGETHCLGGDDELHCPAATSVACPDYAFQCGRQCVVLESRCNGSFECVDRSDELDCNETQCIEPRRRCSSGQCIPAERWCDGHADCLDADDERDCPRLQCINGWRCADGLQCIDSALVCLVRSVAEEIARPGCSDASHLMQCSQFPCPNESFIKCRSGACVDRSRVCDGFPDCLYYGAVRYGLSYTDERWACRYQCSKQLPTECFCRDAVLYCREMMLRRYPTDVERRVTHYRLAGNRLDGDGLLRAAHCLRARPLSERPALARLDLGWNRVERLEPMVLEALSGGVLRVLDLGWNRLERLEALTFYGLPLLSTLQLEGNAIASVEAGAFHGLTSLRHLDLSSQRLQRIDAGAFGGLRQLTSLNLSGNPLRHIAAGAFSGIGMRLRWLDLRSPNGLNATDADRRAFLDLPPGVRLYAPSADWCCLHAAHLHDCQPRVDPLSSCTRLLRTTILRIAVWLMGGVALLANALVVAVRCAELARSRASHAAHIGHARRSARIHSYFIVSLASADFLMGAYLLTIAGADLLFSGRYYRNHLQWRRSWPCQLAGFLALLSCEQSILTLCAMTLVRLRAILYPLDRGRKWSGVKACRLLIVMLWLGCFMLAGAPLLPIEFFGKRGEFYGRSSVCLPLHLTPRRAQGWQYALFMFVGLNTTASAVICAAYVAMYWAALRSASGLSASATAQVRQENSFARRMLAIVLTSLACVLPIALLGLLALAEVDVSEEIYAWAAVFMLPLNASLNPILYTLSTRNFCTSAQGQMRNRAASLRRSVLSVLSGSSSGAANRKQSTSSATPSSRSTSVKALSRRRRSDSTPAEHHTELRRALSVEPHVIAKLSAVNEEIDSDNELAKLDGECQ